MWPASSSPVLCSTCHAAVVQHPLHQPEEVSELRELVMLEPPSHSTSACQ